MNDIQELSPEIRGATHVTSLVELAQFANRLIAFSPNGGTTVHYGELGSAEEDFESEGRGYKVFLATSPGKPSPDSSVTEKDMRDSRFLIKAIDINVLAAQGLDIGAKAAQNK